MSYDSKKGFFGFEVFIISFCDVVFMTAFGNCQLLLLRIPCPIYLSQRRPIRGVG
jgi:hypothetical protein